MLSKETFQKQITQQEFLQAQKIYLAISGGVDSMVLYDLLKKSFPGKQLTLLHVNYGLRENAEQETAYLKQIAQQDQTPLLISYYPKNVGFSEAKGREFRYAFFKDKLQEKSVLLTAHHLNDLGETLLMKLTRGTRLEKMAFFPIRSFGKGYLMRPLLSFSKEEIYQYAHYHQLVYFEDESNQELTYQRNRFRKEIMPLFLAENPHFLQYLYQFNQELITVEKTQVDTFSFKTFLNISSEKKHTYLKQWLKGQGIVLSASAFLQLFFFLQHSTKRRFQVSGGWLEKNEDTLVYTQQKNKEVTAAKEHLLFLNQWVKINDQEQIGYFDEHHLPPLTSGCFEVLPVTGEIPERLIYRQPRSGDILKLKATGYTKKLTRYFIDQKVPKEKRDSQWLVTKPNQEVLWVLPKGKSYLSYQSETDKITYRLIYNKKV